MAERHLVLGDSDNRGPSHEVAKREINVLSAFIECSLAVYRLKTNALQHPHAKDAHHAEAEEDTSYSKSAAFLATTVAQDLTKLRTLTK
jgi:hypothetical protein